MKELAVDECYVGKEHRDWRVIGLQGEVGKTTIVEYGKTVRFYLNDIIVIRLSRAGNVNLFEIRSRAFKKKLGKKEQNSLQLGNEVKLLGNKKRKWKMYIEKYWKAIYNEFSPKIEIEKKKNCL